MKEIAYAPADSGDRRELIDLLGRQLADHGIRVPVGELAAAVDGVLKNPALGFFEVARAGRDVIGVAYVSFIWSLEHGGMSAWLDELYVLPDRRGQGVGTELLRSTLDRARGAGCRAVDLEVDAGHAVAERLYAREGFRSLARGRWVVEL